MSKAARVFRAGIASGRIDLLAEYAHSSLAQLEDRYGVSEYFVRCVMKELGIVARPGGRGRIGGDGGPIRRSPSAEPADSGMEVPKTGPAL